MPSTGPERVHVAAAVLVDRSGRVLIGRRPDHVHQGGRWEFPGGKLEKGEDPATALVRELREELGITPRALRPLIQVIHDYPDRSVLLDVWRVDAWKGAPTGREGQDIEWVAVDRLRERCFPLADEPIITAARLPPVYLVTPEPGPDIAAFMSTLRRCLKAGVRLVQLRARRAAASDYVRIARGALSLCSEYGARLLLNSDPDTADALGAHGVHLTSACLLSLQRRPLHPGHWVAASCHDRRELAHASRIGVDFAVLSPVKATATHPGADPLGWPRFQSLVVEADVPVYALGGLGPSDLCDAWRHGAQGIGSVRALWTDPEAYLQH